MWMILCCSLTKSMAAVVASMLTSHVSHNYSTCQLHTCHLVANLCEYGTPMSMGEKQVCWRVCGCIIVLEDRYLKVPLLLPPLLLLNLPPLPLTKLCTVRAHLILFWSCLLKLYGVTGKNAHEVAY